MSEVQKKRVNARISEYHSEVWPDLKRRSKKTSDREFIEWMIEQCDKITPHYRVSALPTDMLR